MYGWFVPVCVVVCGCFIGCGFDAVGFGCW